jgi:ElaB/YqjD/DUF883 family membrane-anchored ribosome-binding protein
MEERAMRRDVDALKEDLGQLRSDIGGMTENLVGRAREGVDVARERVGEALGTAQERGQEYLKNVQHQIEDRPITSVFVALGVGLVIGGLFFRK